MGQIDEVYFNKLIQFICYWSSNEFTACVDKGHTKKIEISSSITKDYDKFILHIKHYIDLIRSVPGHEPCSFPLLTISLDYKSFIISKHDKQISDYAHDALKKTGHVINDWVCPFVIHNPNPTNITKQDDFKFTEHGREKRISKRRTESDPGAELIFE